MGALYQAYLSRRPESLPLTQSQGTTIVQSINWALAAEVARLKGE